jgi:hypothetical protein
MKDGARKADKREGEGKRRTRRVKALKTSKHAMALMQAHAGMGTTKKRRNCARGAAKAKKEARAYIAPASFPTRGERR